jgi:hypothetical protein
VGHAEAEHQDPRLPRGHVVSDPIEHVERLGHPLDRFRFPTQIQLGLAELEHQ